MSITVLAALTAVNDATMMITALTPLIQRAVSNGEDEISDEDVAAARARLSANIQALDDLIVQAPPG